MCICGSLLYKVLYLVVLTMLLFKRTEIVFQKLSATIALLQIIQVVHAFSILPWIATSIHSRFGYSNSYTRSWHRPRTKIQSTTLNTTDDNPEILSSRVSVDFDDTLQPLLPSYTFAGMVERGLLERFGPPNGHSKDNRIDRVLESWRLLDRDYVHKEHIGSHIGISSGAVGDDGDSQLYQLCHSYVPGLTIKEFWDTSDHAWCAALQAKYKAIRDEFRSVTSDMERLKKEGNNIWASALEADVAQSYGEGWSTLVLMNRGVWDPINVNLFPITAQAIHDSQVPAVEVFFASMKPKSYIPSHSDFTNFVLTSHLAIDIPYSGQNKCRLSVGSTERQWINGEVSLFDTSIMHDAVNESDQMRYILMMRVWHPDLTSIERQALQFTYDVLECPEIVTGTTDEQRDGALRKMAEAKAFPVVSKKGTGRKSGFGSMSGKMSSGKKGKK